MSRVRPALLASIAIGFACGGGDAPPPTAPTPGPGAVTEVPTSLPPRTAIEEAVRNAYQRELGEPIFRPAIFNDPAAVNCAGAGHLASTAYLRTSTRQSRLLFIYASRDGTQVTRREAVPGVVTPAGRFRVLVAVLIWPATVPDESLPLWEAAQAQINEHHRAFAAAKGYAEPIVSFESTNVRIPGTEVATPGTPAGLAPALSARGISTAGYDFVAVLNVDPAKREGGFALTGTSDPPFVYVGNYGAFTGRVTAPDFADLAATVYHHEIAHHWGWPATHDWAGACGGLRLGFEPLIAPPVLFGWEDVDGDRVPEILDTTPYGRSR
jgi:hypothetical protein